MTIYPQWTQGRTVEVGQLKFIQPFSQIPGATPLVRLRLGELWKSNYSKMAIARLFGATTLPGYKVSSRTPQTAANEDLEKKIANIRLFATSPTSAIIPDGTVKRNAFEFYLSDLLGDSDKMALRMVASEIRLLIPQSVLSFSVSDNDNDIVLAKLTALPDGENVQLTNLELQRVGSEVRRSLVSSPTAPILIRNDQVKVFLDTEKTINLARTRARQSLVPDTTTNGVGDLSATEFYQDTMNPVIKAFKSSGGAGLAGFVSDFKVEYDPVATWNTDPVSGRAPRLLKLSITLDVVHDITPGLDANGIMNAPLWMVGRPSTALAQNGNAPLSSPASTTSLRWFSSRKGNNR
jgi:hypothetical protein